MSETGIGNFTHDFYCNLLQMFLLLLASFAAAAAVAHGFSCFFWPDWLLAYGFKFATFGRSIAVLLQNSI